MVELNFWNVEFDVLKIEFEVRKPDFDFKRFKLICIKLNLEFKNCMKILLAVDIVENINDIFIFYYMI